MSISKYVVQYTMCMLIYYNEIIPMYTAINNKYVIDFDHLVFVIKNTSYQIILGNSILNHLKTANRLRNTENLLLCIYSICHSFIVWQPAMRKTIVEVNVHTAYAQKKFSIHVHNTCMAPMYLCQIPVIFEGKPFT